MIVFYYDAFLKVLNLRALAPPSRLAFIVGAWLLLQKISTHSEFVDVGSAIEVGLDYPGLVCNTGDF